MGLLLGYLFTVIGSQFTVFSSHNHGSFLIIYEDVLFFLTVNR